MFRKLPHGIIESDKGFSVRVLGRAGLEYKEGKKALFVDSESLADSAVGLVVFTSSIKRWKNAKKNLFPNERRRIIDNIKQAFKFEGYEIEISRTK